MLPQQDGFVFESWESFLYVGSLQVLLSVMCTLGDLNDVIIFEYVAV